MSDTPAKKEDVIPQQLTAQDRVYVSLLDQGFTKPQAFEEAYQDNVAVVRLKAAVERLDILEDENDFSADMMKDIREARYDVQLARTRVGQLAREKAKTKKISIAFNTFSRRMEDIAVDALDVWEDLMLNARSEKVRADLVVRAVEHQTGQPTVKVLSQQNNEITITVGDAPEDRRDARQVAIDKARMQAGLDEQTNVKSRRETPQDPLVIDLETE